jgi:hypothetical protein
MLARCRFSPSGLKRHECRAQFLFGDVGERQAWPFFDRLAQVPQEHHDVRALAAGEVADFVVVANQPDERVDVQRLRKYSWHRVALEQGIVLAHLPVAKPPAGMGNMGLYQQSQGNRQAVFHPQ